MISEEQLKPWSMDRVFAAVQAVEHRLQRCVRLFRDANIGYALIGGRATMSWIESVDPGASRNTPNVDFLVNRADLSRITQTLLEDKWIHRESASRHYFVDSTAVKVSSGVRLVVAEERFRPDDLLPTPPIDESQILDDIRVIELEALIRMKLTAFRTIDRVHLDDLLSVELFDPSWTARFSSEFAPRLADIFDVHDVWPDLYVDAMSAAGFQSDEELVEFQRHCRQSGDQRLNSLPWFLARENAHQKVRVA